jgi:hypothetical protein
LLENELVTRYYYREGAIENSFAYDIEMKKAIELLSNPVLYKAALKAQ